MTENTTICKSASMSKEDFAMFKDYIVKGVAAAGAASLIAGMSRKKTPKKSNTSKDIARQGSAIVVPIKINNFMKDVKTPAEQREMVGEPAVAGVSSGAQVASQPKPAAGVALSPEEIAAKKKEILKKNERSLNFFGKRASDSDKDDSKPKETDKNDEGSDNGDSNDSKKKAPLLPRNEIGQFVSPTNPVAVKQEEKSAGILDAVKEPLALTAGAAISLYVANKITDAINRRRQLKANKDLDISREKYIALVQGDGNEKKAWGLGETIASTFVFPAGIAALVTHKIIENRKIDKNKKKELNNSFPDDTVVLYKTSEDHTVEISAKTAAGMILVKQAMFSAAMETGHVKEAFDWPSLKIDPKFLAGRFSLNKKLTETEALNDVINRLSDPKNNQYLLGAAQAYYKKDYGKAKRIIGENLFGPNDALNSGILTNPEFHKKVMADPRFQNLITSRFTDKNYVDSWGKWGDDVFDDQIARKLGLKAGGWLHRLISGLGRWSGLGRGLVINGVENMLGKQVAAQSPGKVNAPAAQPPKPAVA